MSALGKVEYDRSWRGLADEELRHYLVTYRRRLALLDEEVADAALRVSTGEYLRMLIADGEREDALRERAVLAGVPRDHPRFPPGWLVDLKARIPLDDFLAGLFALDLSRPVNGRRHGTCPLCQHGTDCFLVYLADPEDQHYHCFRCLASGDAINAVRQRLGLGFVAAVTFLARHAGVALPREEVQRPASLPSRVTPTGRRPGTFRRRGTGPTFPRF